MLVLKRNPGIGLKVYNYNNIENIKSLFLFITTVIGT